MVWNATSVSLLIRAGVAATVRALAVHGSTWIKIEACEQLHATKLVAMGKFPRAYQPAIDLANQSCW